MPTVHFEAGPAGAAKTIDAPEGGSLADLCDEHRAPVPFDCRTASCASCRVEVLAGEGLLEPAEDDELNLLDQLCDPPGRRLACQARVKPGSGLLKVRALGDSM